MFREMRNRVTCVNIDSVKIEKLIQEIIPIFEPSLETMFLKNVKNKNLFFTTELSEDLNNSEIAFKSLETPMGDDDSIIFQEVKNQFKNHIIFDGRNQYSAFDLEEKEFEYYQIGKL